MVTTRSSYFSLWLFPQDVTDTDLSLINISKLTVNKEVTPADFTTAYAFK